MAPANAALYDNSFLYASNYDDGQVDRLAVDALGALGASTRLPRLAPGDIDRHQRGGDRALRRLERGRHDRPLLHRRRGRPDVPRRDHSAKGSDLAMTPDGAFLYAIKADSGPASSGTFQGYAVGAPRSPS